MDFASLLGLFSGVALVITAMIMQAGSAGDLIQFASLGSIMIVLGGTMAATAIGFRINEILRVFTLVKFVVTKQKYVLHELVQELIEASEIYRKGPAELEKHVESVKTPFIKDGLSFIVQSIKYDDLKSILIQREKFRYTRETHESDLMKTLGMFSPAFGMIGTLIGLIFMLNNMDGGADAAASIGPAMGIALITTLPMSA